MFSIGTPCTILKPWSFEWRPLAGAAIRLMVKPGTFGNESTLAVGFMVSRNDIGQSIATTGKLWSSTDNENAFLDSRSEWGVAASAIRHAARHPQALCGVLHSSPLQMILVPDLFGSICLPGVV
jgi:hypothetical protein